MNICVYTIASLVIKIKIIYSYKYDKYIVSSICFPNRSIALISFRIRCLCNFSGANFFIMTISSSVHLLCFKISGFKIPVMIIVLVISHILYLQTGLKNKIPVTYLKS